MGRGRDEGEGEEGGTDESVEEEEEEEKEEENEEGGEVGVGNEGRGGRRKRVVGFERREVAVMSAVQKKGTIRRTHRHTNGR